jgi:hypothetical protein
MFLDQMSVEQKLLEQKSLFQLAAAAAAFSIKLC